MWALWVQPDSNYPMAMLVVGRSAPSHALRVERERELVRHHWSGMRSKRSAAPLAGLLALAAMLGFAATPSGAQTGDGVGSAFGYSAKYTIFGGPFDVPPSPSVTLPAGGSATPVTGSIPSARVQSGPGILFTSGPIDISTQGSAGSVTSKTHISGTNTSNVEILTAGTMDSTCTASASGVTGSATFAGPGSAGHTSATLRTSSGDPDKDGDEVYADIPANPPPNTAINGNLEEVGDTFQLVFNEQVTNADGTLTVNAVHERLLGPTALGDIYIGQSVCGASGGTSSTNDPAATDTTGAGGTGTSGSGTSGSGTSGSGTSGTGTSGSGTSSSGTSGSGTSGMPTTGADVVPLSVLGLELLVGGVAAVRWSNRRRPWPGR